MCFCYGDRNYRDECMSGYPIPSGKDGFFFRRTLPLPLLLLCRVKELIETIGIPFVLIGNCPVCQFPLSFTFLIFKSLILIKDLVNTFSLARSFNRISPDNVDEVTTNSTTVEMSATQTNAACVTRKYSSPQPIHVMVDRQCPNGHQLHVVNGKPATYPGWMCDLCGNLIPHDSFGVLHCSACQFDLCCGCQAQNFRCPQGHALLCQHNIPSNYRGWSCDGCHENIPHDARGILHCKTCKYDICHNCRNGG